MAHKCVYPRAEPGKVAQGGGIAGFANTGEGFGSGQRVVNMFPHGHRAVDGPGRVQGIGFDARQRGTPTMGFSADGAACRTKRKRPIFASIRQGAVITPTDAASTRVLRCVAQALQLVRNGPQMGSAMVSGPCSDSGSESSRVKGHISNPVDDFRCHTAVHMWAQIAVLCKLHAHQVRRRWRTVRC